MSKSRLEKQLKKPRPEVSDPLEFTPAVLADIKGRYLERVVQAEYYPERSILWWCKSGARRGIQLRSTDSEENFIDEITHYYLKFKELEKTEPNIHVTFLEIPY